MLLRVIGLAGCLEKENERKVRWSKWEVMKVSLPQLQRPRTNFCEQCELCKKLVEFLVRKKSNADESDRSH